MAAPKAAPPHASAPRSWPWSPETRRAEATERAASLATLSEPEAVRQRFDERNVAVMVWLSRLAVVLALINVTASGVAPKLLPLLALVSLVVFTRVRGLDHGKARWLRAADALARPVDRHRRAVALTIFLAMYGCVIAREGVGAEEVDPWVAIFPCFALALLMPALERFLLHGALVLGAVLPGVLTATPHHSELVAMASSINGMVFLAGVAFNRTSRRAFVRTWAAARHHFLERQKLQGELDYAREIQLSMLPRENPAVAWLEVAGFSLPAMEVGGDYYDYVVLDDDRVVIVTADVAGHGLGSALMVSGLRSCVKLLAPELANGPAVMARLGAMVRETTRHHMKVSLSLALLDRRGSRATITSAAQPPPLVWRQATGSVEAIDLGALPLGTRLPRDYPSREVTLGPHDLLVLYTDGVYEMLGPDDAIFGLDRLVAAAAARRWDSPADLREALLQELWAFKGARAQEDDVTLLVVRMNGG